MLHTYLFSCFPIVYFWSKNQYLLPLHYLLGICSINICLVFLLNTLFKKSKYFLLLEVLFSFSCFLVYYGFLIGKWIAYDLLKGFFLYCPAIRTHKFELGCVLCLFLLIISLFLFKKQTIQKTINKCFNVFGSILFVFLLANVLYLKASEKTFNKNSEKLIYTNTLPNIYHILLDAYTNEFVLKTVYRYDNQYFYEFLTHHKFKVFNISYSSYCTTVPSVSQMLNFGELEIDKIKVDDVLNLNLPNSTITNNNKVWPLLEKNGYHIYGFNYTVPFVYKNCQQKILKGAISTFLIALFYQTPLSKISFKVLGNLFYKNRANDIFLTFEDLKNAPDMYGLNNNYFYMHVVCPHEPFMFNEEGNLNKSRNFNGMFVGNSSDENYNEQFTIGYVNNVKKVTQLTVETITSILSQYDKDNMPIIILHGDHGCPNGINNLKTIKTAIKNNNLSPNMHGYLGNLFAIYMPESWKKDAKDLTFNNLYRFIFNHLFNTNYEYLPPRHFINNVEVPHELLVKRPAE